MNNNCAPSRRMHRGNYFGSWPMHFEDLMRGKDFAGQVPAVNIIENDNDWKVEVSAPGFSKEDFKINLESNILTVSAEHKAEATTEQKNYSRREFSPGSFSRSFRVKENSVNVENISASYDNGILNITLPKLVAEPKKGVNIQIQ